MAKHMPQDSAASARIPKHRAPSSAGSADPWMYAAQPTWPAQTPPPPLPGESAALIRARELIRHGPMPVAAPVGVPTPPVMGAANPVVAPAKKMKRQQPEQAMSAPAPVVKTTMKAPAKTYMRPDGTPVPDHRPHRHPRSAPPPNVPTVAAAAPQIAPARATVIPEIVLELPGAYVTPDVAAPPPTRRRRQLEPEVILPIADVVPADVNASPAQNACPICHGAGFLRLDVQVGHPAFGRAVPCACREREVMRRRRDELWRLSRLEAFADMTFDRFNANWPGTREAFDVARRYADEQDPPWLVLSGPCGSGKTHLAAAIANARFQQGEVVLFTVVPQLLDHLRATFAPTSETTYDALFEKVREAGLLVLDDLGAEQTTAWAQEKLFQIINHRYIHRLPTVITTNQSMQMLDDRIRSRASDIRLVRHVVIQAEDFRPRNVTPRRRGRDEPLW